MNLRILEQLIQLGDFAKVRSTVDDNPELFHTDYPDQDAWKERKSLYSAVRHGQPDHVKFLVERGGEVYSNPVNTHRAVSIADRNHVDWRRPGYAIIYKT